MLPVIEAFKQKYNMQQLVVADAGLMSNKNIQQLIDKQYSFIIGARIKNETQLVQAKILALKLEDGQSIEIKKDAAQRIILSYSNARALKDAHNRKKGLERLKTQLTSGKLTKEYINNKSYNKYLKLEGEIKVIIDEHKFNEDAKLDGLKGYTTNTKLSKETVLDYYKQLWQVEKTFRITKPI